MVPVQFNRYKEMQEQLKLEKAVWEEQQGRSPQPQAGIQRTAFQIGSMFGSVRKAMAAGVTSQASGAALPGEPAQAPRGSAEGAERATAEQATSSLPVRCWRPRHIPVMHSLVLAVC